MAFSYNFSGNKYSEDIEKLLFEKYLPQEALQEDYKFKLEENYTVPTN